MYPDSLTILMPKVLTLEGIILVSSSYGWLKDYIVETESNSVWSTVATLANCDTLLQLIIFPNSVSTKGLRITVTLTQRVSKDLYSRINEIIPVVAGNTSGATTSSETSEPSSTTKSNTSSGTTASFNVFQPSSSAKSNASSDSSTQKPQPQTILAGLFGGILGISLLVLAAVLLRKRRKGHIQIVPAERYVAHRIGTLAKPSPAHELQDTSPYPQLSASQYPELPAL